MDDTFQLYNLEVIVTGDPATFACSHAPGLAFRVVGENLVFAGDEPKFSLYALASLLPLLPVKQRETHPHDWASTDDFVACPDPNCGARFQIKRTTKTTFHHADVTKVPLNPTQTKD